MTVKFILPTDVVLADKFAADANTKVVSVDAIPDGWMGLDNGVRARVHIHPCVWTHTCVCVHIHTRTLNTQTLARAHTHTHIICVCVCAL